MNLYFYTMSMKKNIEFNTELDDILLKLMQEQLHATRKTRNRGSMKEAYVAMARAMLASLEKK